MRIIWGLLGCLFCATLIAAEPPLACRTSLVPSEFHPPAEDLVTGKLPLQDYQDTLIACLTADPWSSGIPSPDLALPPRSIWLDEERARYAAILARQPADVLVVPFQVQGYGLDRIERAVMAADLAYAIGDASKLKVADPFLTALALGEGERRIDAAAVERLAQQVGARKIVIGYVGHDLAHAFTLTLQLWDTGSTAAKQWQRDWRSLAFSNEKTPAYVFHEMLPSVLKELPLGLAAKRVSARLAPAPSKVSAGPLELVSARSKSGIDIATMSLLAATLPAGAELARERLFERTLLTAMRAGSSKPEQRFFEAYALLNLHRRPVALARIHGAGGASFDALRALLDGNLPAAQAATRGVKNPLEQLLIEFLLRDLEYYYAVQELTPPTSVERLFTEQALPAWLSLLEQRFEDGNIWFVMDAVYLKWALDQAFPAEPFRIDSLVQGSAAIGGAMPDDFDIDVANTRHARHAAAALAVPACCRTQDLRPEHWDLLWTLEGVAHERVNRHLGRMIFVQGRSPAAIELIGRYEPLFKGHPEMAALSAHAAIRVAEKSPDDEHAHWTARTVQDGRAALRWSPGQNRIAYSAALSLGIPSESTVWLDVYGYDFPRRSDWPIDFLGLTDPAGEMQRHAFVAEALAFSTSDISPLQHMRGAALESALASLGSRFTGHPARPNSSTAEPDDVGRTLAEGYRLLHSTQPLDEALAAFLAYPLFGKPDPLDPVAVANDAAEIGSRFFWLGQGHLAKPLLQIAADLETGADASLMSEQRLRLLAGDYQGAMEMALRRSQRYSSSYAQRDYLSLMHAFGEHEAAWSAFSQLRLAQGHPALWISAIVGHRVQKLDEPAVRAWLKTPEIRDAKFKAQRFASYFALIWNSTDRVPPADLGQLVAELEGKPVAFIEAGGILRPHPVSPRSTEFVLPTFVPADASKVARPPDGTPVRSERAFFADAYSALARAEYSKSVERFAAMARLYPIEGAALSYFAYAASKTGDAVQFEKYVATARPNDKYNFDVLLARAFFAAARRELDDSYRWLTLAFRAKPYTDERPIDVDYQYAQACEWLFKDTEDARFLATLLEWARNYQSVQPAMAWAYAVQYQYEKDPGARVRALGMTLHLDPLSERIKAASRADVEEARRWLKKNNPFRDKAVRNEGQALADLARSASEYRVSD